MKLFLLTKVVKCSDPQHDPKEFQVELGANELNILNANNLMVCYVTPMPVLKHFCVRKPREYLHRGSN